MGFLDGALRIMPAWEPSVAGRPLALGVLLPRPARMPPTVTPAPAVGTLRGVRVSIHRATRAAVVSRASSCQARAPLTPPLSWSRRASLRILPDAVIGKAPVTSQRTGTFVGGQPGAAVLRELAGEAVTGQASPAAAGRIAAPTTSP